jgi:hypothetical protein
MKKSIMATIIFLAMVNPAMALDTTQTYNSPILVLLFVGFCALLIVAQLVPACLMLFGMTKAVTRQENGKRVQIKS